MGVRGDGQDALGRQPAADLDEVPDVVDAETVPGRQLAGHVGVVVGVGVGRIDEERRHQDAGHEGDAEEQDGDRHDRPTLATAAHLAGSTDGLQARSRVSGLVCWGRLGVGR